MLTELHVHMYIIVLFDQLIIYQLMFHIILSFLFRTKRFLKHVPDGRQIELGYFEQGQVIVDTPGLGK